MAYVPVSRTVTQKFGGVIELRMAVNKAVSGWKVSGRCPRLSACPPASFRSSIPRLGRWLLWIIYRLHCVFIAAQGLSLVLASQGYSRRVGFSLWWLLLLQSTDSKCVGFSSCSTRAQ